MNKDFLVISGGNIDKDFLKVYIKMQKFYVTIAVDRGLEAVDELNMDVDFIVGDFDSVDSNILKKYEKKVHTKRYSSEKDYTDTDIAVDFCIKSKADSVTIIGGTGTRLDHVFGNLAVVSDALDKGTNVCIVDKNNKIYMTSSEISLERSRQYGRYVSIFPYGSEAIVTLEGFKYNLNEYLLENTKSIGVSNEIIDDVAKVKCHKGRLIIMETVD